MPRRLHGCPSLPTRGQSRRSRLPIWPPQWPSSGGRRLGITTSLPPRRTVSFGWAIARTATANFQTAIPYANPSRFDAVIDPTQPEALLYEPRANGKLTLAGVELVIPYAAWAGTQPPTFFGVPFQREDEFGVFGLHVWIWRNNPDGLFAIANPRATCSTAP